MVTVTKTVRFDAAHVLTNHAGLCRNLHGHTYRVEVSVAGEADGGDGTNQTLRLQALGQMGSIKRTIQQIDEALHRIDEGTYGVCTVCGQLIRKPRLQNQPFVLTCMECQSEMERADK